MIQDLRAAFPSDHKFQIANALRNIRNGGARYFMPFLDGSYMENWTRGLAKQDLTETISASIQLAHEASYKGKLILLNTGPWGCGWPCLVSKAEWEEGIGMPLATFLVLAEDHACFNYITTPNVLRTEQWDASGLAELNMPLGQPLGPTVKVGNVFTRSFEFLDVKLDLEKEEATFIKK